MTRQALSNYCSYNLYELYATIARTPEVAHRLPFEVSGPSTHSIMSSNELSPTIPCIFRRIYMGQHTRPTSVLPPAQTQIWLRQVNDAFGRLHRMTTTPGVWAYVSHWVTQPEGGMQPVITFDPLRLVPSLPLELQYLILRFIFWAGHYPDISSCRLVSRNWNLECQRTLFRFMRLVDHNPRVIHRLFRALSAAPSHIITSIEEFEIQSSTCCILDLTRLSHTLPNLRVLRFIYPDYYRDYPVHPNFSQYFPSIFSGYSSLKILHIHGCVFQTPRDLLRLCQRAKALESLECTKTTFTTYIPNNRLSSMPLGHHRIRRIVLHQTSDSALQNQLAVWFWAAPKSPRANLQSQEGLRFPGLDHEDASTIQQFLEKYFAKEISEWEIRRLTGCDRCKQYANHVR